MRRDSLEITKTSSLFESLSEWFGREPYPLLSMHRCPTQYCSGSALKENVKLLLFEEWEATEEGRDATPVEAARMEQAIAEKFGQEAWPWLDREVADTLREYYLEKAHTILKEIWGSIKQSDSDRNGFYIPWRHVRCWDRMRSRKKDVFSSILKRISLRAAVHQDRADVIARNILKRISLRAAVHMDIAIKVYLELYQATYNTGHVDATFGRFGVGVTRKDVGKPVWEWLGSLSIRELTTIDYTSKTARGVKYGWYYPRTASEIDDWTWKRPGMIHQWLMKRVDPTVWRNYFLEPIRDLYPLQ